MFPATHVRLANRMPLARRVLLPKRELTTKPVFARAAGAGVLLISEDLDELLALSDRVAVLHEGHIAGIVVPGTVDRYDIGRLMLEGAA